jgi:hypothetical protein
MPTPPRRRWFQFGLRELLWSVTLMALGTGLIVQAFDLPSQLTLIALLIGGAIIGAGVLLPIRRPGLGAILGFVVMIFVILGLAYLVWISARNNGLLTQQNLEQPIVQGNYV